MGNALQRVAGSGYELKSPNLTKRSLTDGRTEESLQQPPLRSPKAPIAAPPPPFGATAILRGALLDFLLRPRMEPWREEKEEDDPDLVA